MSEYLLSGEHYYKSGIYSIKEGNNSRLYKSLKKLKLLSHINKEINNNYLKLGNETSKYLKTFK